MKKLLILAAVIAFAACGSKKKSPQSPANAAEPAAAESSAADAEQDKAAPTDKDDATKMGSDPCEGGE